MDLSAPPEPVAATQAEDFAGESARSYARYWFEIFDKSGPPSRWRIISLGTRDLWPRIAVFRAIENDDFIRNFVGYEIRYRSPMDDSASKISEAEDETISVILRHSLLTCIRLQRPVISTRPYTGPQSDVLSWREGIFPFSSSQGRITHLASVIDFVSRARNDKFVRI